MTNELTPEQLTTLGNALYAGNKIEAIKLYRTVTGKDLKDSKDAVEKLAAELEAKNPAMFARRRSHGGSLATWVFWATIAAVVVYFALSWD
mgnify:CR=1 FL=1|jgi:hypothetical protein